MKLCKDATGSPIQAMHFGKSQSISFDGTSAQSSGITSHLVRVVATQDCFLAVGANPTASSSGVFLPASAIEYFGVDTDGWKIAVIQSSQAGTLYITEAG